jgi:hypothetical protein
MGSCHGLTNPAVSDKICGTCKRHAGHARFPRETLHVRFLTRVAHRTIPAKQLPQGDNFGAAVIHSCSVHHLLGPQIAPTARPLRVLGGRAIYTRPNSESLPAPSTGIATCLNRAIGTAGLSPAGFRPCRLLLPPLIELALTCAITSISNVSF